MRTLFTLVLALLLLAACAAAPAAKSGITVTEPWARSTAGAGANVTSAAYMTLRNESGAADRLLSASCDAAAAVELHKSEMKDGVMSMAPVQLIEIPAGGQVQLKPGGLHVMLIGVGRQLKAGEKLPLKLRFERAGEVTVQAEVRAP
jgi:hypothetical protein